MQRKYHYPSEKAYASKGKRLANLVVDRIIIYIVTFLLGIFAYIISEFLGIHDFLVFIEQMNAFEELLFSILLTLLYYTVMEATTGRTIGKLVTNTTVINEDEQKVDFGQAFLRSLCRLIPFEAFSFLGSEGRGWHDSIPKTFVVDIKKYEEEKQIQQGLDELGTNIQEL